MTQNKPILKVTPCFDIEDQHGHIIAIIAGADKTELQRFEISKFIVKCVNCHTDLLEALEQLIGFLPRTYDNSHYIKQAKAAINKATS